MLGKHSEENLSNSLAPSKHVPLTTGPNTNSPEIQHVLSFGNESKTPWIEMKDVL